ncbi:hypothetical protein SAMN05216197_12229 [Pseudomonas graminis]|uniref:Uncharacterized protein n=1 Tax=Pseudomonas graminis TaxID=158627 RepID=A0A1I0GLN7_9PSED|nr:hypothetical protein SAMN05216197_12229 [Pseudomonas graminis]
MSLEERLPGSLQRRLTGLNDMTDLRLEENRT